MIANDTAERMFFIHFGAEHVPHDLSVRGGTATYYWEPFLGVVVETLAGWVLLDTGMSRRAFESPDIALTYRAGSQVHQTEPWRLSPVPPAGSDWGWIQDGDPLETALAGVGLSVGDLSLAAVTHLHVDHSGGIPTLSRFGVPIAIDERELAFARSGAVGAEHGFFAPDWEDPGTTWHEVASDIDIAPGVRAIRTPGHTPGHLSFAVTLRSSGTWLFAGDAADLSQNFLEGAACGSTASGTNNDERAAEASLDRLFDFARDRSARIIPGHDALVQLAVQHPKGGHR